MTIFTGRVEFGQGVLTAMAQIAAEELDVALARIAITSGDTALTPNEGYTAGSQSMQFGGVALRQACADVRALFLDAAAKAIGCGANELSVRDGSILRDGAATGQDYWTLAGAVDLKVKASGAGKRKATADFTTIGASTPRLDLPAKIFGDSVFIHDMKIAGMKHARVVRQPNRGATIGAIDEAAIKKAAKAPVTLVRTGNFLAIVGDSEMAVEAAAVAADTHVTWQNVEAPMATQQEASWLLQRPAIDRVIGEPEPSDAQGRQRFEATYSKHYLAHASMAPSCGLARYDNGHLTVWTQCQGVFPLRAALARTLKLDPSVMTVHHVQGAGCYGHNGADDAAADAAITAMQMPGVPVRVRWRREEEFVYEPKGSAMVVKVRALTDASGKPADWTTEIWSGTHQGRPGSGAPLLPRQRPARSPALATAERRAGIQRRRRHPQCRTALRHRAEAHPASHGDGDAGARVLAARARRHRQCVRARMRHRRTGRAGRCRPGRLPAVDHLRCRARVPSSKKRRPWPTGSRARRPAAAPAAALPSRATRTRPATPPWWSNSTSTRRSACAMSGARPMSGLAVNPDGVLNQLEGGIIQAASWVLKEQVRFDAGVASFDWETYPVLKFSEVPEIDIELINTHAEAPLGAGEVTGGPTAAAIGNAVSHALGARIRDLPLTRERVMAALLTT